MTSVFLPQRQSIGPLLGALVALCAALLPFSAGRAAGLIWLPTQTATSGSTIYLHPSLAAYHDHAYIASVRENGTSGTSVYFTTNESSHWITTLLSSSGPPLAYSQEFASIAVDPSSGTLYVAWIHTNLTDSSVEVMTRAAGGTWSGPSPVYTANTVSGPASIEAGIGSAAVSFGLSPNTVRGACDDTSFRAKDIALVSASGGNWSSPTNVTSCVPNTDAGSFDEVKLTGEGEGNVYLIARAFPEAHSNLWEVDNASGSWSTPQQVASNADTSESAGSPAFRNAFAVAVDQGEVYVVYDQGLGTQGDDVYLAVRPSGGSWSAPSRVSPADSGGCHKFGLSVAAEGGRVAAGYIRSFGGACHVIKGDFNVSHVVVGTPGSLASVGLGLPKNSSCGDTALATDVNVFRTFRLVLSCGYGSQKLQGRLFYKPEFLDIVPPVVHLSATVKGHTIILHWSGRDPSPGSGLDYYTLQVQQGGGSWTTLVGNGHGKSFKYTGAQSGHTYTFRLRAVDRVNNVGTWVTAAVHVG